MALLRTALLTLVFLFSVSSAFAAAPNCVDVQKSFAALKADKSQEVSAERLAQLAPNAAVILAGEIHFYTPSGALIQLVQAFAKTRGPKACVAFESARRDEDFDETMANLQRDVMKMQKQAGAARTFALAWRGYLKQYGPVVEAAVKAGLKAKSVDHARHDVSDIDMAVRTHAMSENIGALFKSGECAAVLFIVGKGHLAISSDNPERLQDLLAAQGLKTVSLNVQITDESKLLKGVRALPQCALPNFVDARVFRTLDAPAGLDPAFDLTLLIPSR